MAETHSEPLFFTQSSIHTPTLRVVLLHGLGGESSVWNELRAILERKYPVETVAFDLAGQGRSSRQYPIEMYGVTAQAELICEQLSALPKLPTVLVGHCYGSLVSLVLAEKMGRLEKLILISTGQQLPIVGELAVHTIGKRFFDSVFNSMYAIIPKTHIAKRRDFTSVMNAGQFSVRRVFQDVLHTSLPTYLQLLWKAAQFSAAEYLRLLKVPTHILQGADDLIYPVRKLLPIVEANKHLSLTVLPNAHHVMVLQFVRTKLFSEIAALCEDVLKEKGLLKL